MKPKKRIRLPRRPSQDNPGILVSWRVAAEQSRRRIMLRPRRGSTNHSTVHKEDYQE